MVCADRKTPSAQPDRQPRAIHREHLTTQSFQSTRASLAFTPKLGHSGRPWQQFADSIHGREVSIMLRLAIHAVRESRYTS
jgi:hypothetical protein